MEPLKLSKDGSVHVTGEKFNTVSHLAAAMFALSGAVVFSAGKNRIPYQADSAFTKSGTCSLSPVLHRLDLG